MLSLPSFKCKSSLELYGKIYINPQTFSANLPMILSNTASNVQSQQQKCMKLCQWEKSSKLIRIRPYACLIKFYTRIGQIKFQNSILQFLSNFIYEKKIFLFNKILFGNFEEVPAQPNVKIQRPCDCGIFFFLSQITLFSLCRAPQCSSVF